MKKQLSDNEIEGIYEMLCDYHKKYLNRYGVKLPKLTDAQGQYTKDALVLVHLAQGYPNTREVSKGELTQFIRQYYPNINDVRQARHLGAQKGWFIASGGRDNRDVVLTRGEYKLVSLEKPYPAFHGHRIEQTEDWEELKSLNG
jgi:hypothetical protein